MEIARIFICPICTEDKALHLIKVCSECDNYICKDCHTTMIEDDKIKCPHCRHIEEVKQCNECPNLECCSCSNFVFDIIDPPVHFTNCEDCKGRVICSECYDTCKECEEQFHNIDLYKEYGSEIKLLRSYFKHLDVICHKCWNEYITINNRVDTIGKKIETNFRDAYLETTETKIILFKDVMGDSFKELKQSASGFTINIYNYMQSTDYIKNEIITDD